MMFCIWWSYWSMAILFFVIAILGLWEFYSLLEKANYAPQKFTGISLGVIIMATSLYINQFMISIVDSAAISWPLVPFIAILFFIELFRNKENPFQNIGYTILGLLYILPAFIFLSANANSFSKDAYSNGLLPIKYEPQFILGFFLLIWVNDIFAYLVGMQIGKRKLFERISPNKTWEGTIGGGILTLVAACVIAIYFTEIAVIHWLVIAVIVTVAGTLGDLVESMLKRSLNVKDSGSILPGHGGILDRFDGVLLSSPFVCIYLLLIH